jgi:hypothetical protein
MHHTAIFALNFLFLAFSKGDTVLEKNVTFTQLELSRLTALLQGRGCTFLKKAENQYFISVYKEERPSLDKNEALRIAQIKASYQTQLFLKNDEKLFMVLSDAGVMSQMILKKPLTDITRLHSMVIDNAAKNQVIRFQNEMGTFYIFYVKT